LYCIVFKHLYNAPVDPYMGQHRRFCSSIELKSWIIRARAHFRKDCCFSGLAAHAFIERCVGQYENETDAK